MKTYICAPVRSAIGSFQGSLAKFTAPDLGALSLAATLKAANVEPGDIDEVFMGCVLTAGVGQAPARQASIRAGVPDKVPATTVGKVCGSGLKAVMLADLTLRAGEARAVLAGGMESMSGTPYLIPKIREGLRLGNGELIDSMINDGLWDVYNNFHMGTAAELCARELKISREEQDDFAAASYSRAQRSNAAGHFKDEIFPIQVPGKKGPTVFETDEEPGKGDLTKFATLRPVFDPKGTVTAANASSLNDGAASMLLCTEEFVKEKGLRPLGRILCQAQAAQKPEWFTTAPALSVELLLKKAEVQRDAIDLWEINEAFAAVAIVNTRLLKLDPAKINIRGGAVALGHPIGASGARILVTLLHALRAEGKRLGVASICLGGGEAASVLVESLG